VESLWQIWGTRRKSASDLHSSCEDTSENGLGPILHVAASLDEPKATRLATRTAMAKRISALEGVGVDGGDERNGAPPRAVRRSQGSPQSTGDEEAGDRNIVASYHRSAAYHHFAAAMHHCRAAIEHDEGNAEQGVRFARAANLHGDYAAEDAGSARRGLAKMLDGGRRPVGDVNDSDAS
jgi:hypothetical protein